MLLMVFFCFFAGSGYDAFAASDYFAGRCNSLFSVKQCKMCCSCAEGENLPLEDQGGLDCYIHRSGASLALR